MLLLVAAGLVGIPRRTAQVTNVIHLRATATQRLGGLTPARDACRGIGSLNGLV
jgi:hypothetical protein